MCSSGSLSSVRLLVLAARVMSLENITDEDAMEMEQKEHLGLFDALGSLLEDPTWPQMHPKPCTDTPWPGIECEIERDPPIFHVTRIHIGPDILTPPCKTSAKLSQSLLKLPYLKTLSLFSCFTSSPVSLSPFLFGSAFSSLEHLSLGSNPSLSGDIPPSIAEIVSLRVLCLSQNSLQGEIPKEINGLFNLEELDLSYNFFSGSIPQEIGGMKSLTILNLSWNSLKGEVPCSLGQLQLLQKIDLSSNKLQGRIPSDLGHLKSLVLLDLSHNTLSGPIPETLSGLEQLQYLMLEDNSINTGIPIFIGALMGLNVLSLSRCGLVGPIPTSFFNLKNLTALSLDNNSLNGTVSPNLGTLPNLDQLNLSHNQFSGELQLPEEFIEKPGKRLDVRGNNGLCKKHQIYSNKKSSFSLPADDSKKMKPVWYEGDMSSSSPKFDQKFVFPCLFFLVLFA
ncbi:unnamed protein product [Ilex paraguariensis]|uniref:Piriformospora indica-insensitive protein 2 n=1 Tax=Ilex paraguariensis TaxID=185542 RepID=A0ABC8T2L6_9AQUA